MIQVQDRTSPSIEDGPVIMDLASEAIPDPGPGPPGLSVRPEGGPDPAPGLRVVIDTGGKPRSPLCTLNLMEELRQYRPSMATPAPSRTGTGTWCPRAQQ